MNQRSIENIFYFYFCFNVYSPINHVYIHNTYKMILYMYHFYSNITES